MSRFDVDEKPARTSVFYEVALMWTVGENVYAQTRQFDAESTARVFAEGQRQQGRDVTGPWQVTVTAGRCERVLLVQERVSRDVESVRRLLEDARRPG